MDERDRRIYPKECFTLNEDITRKRMRAYDRYIKRIHNKCLNLCENYDRLPLRERMEIRNAAERMVGRFVP